MDARETDSSRTGLIHRAAELIQDADALIICAGAGMGADSGLPDFRGDDGFWGAYPALKEARLRFTEIASPRTFHTEPHLAWGFYGHRSRPYRNTVPHDGFSLLRDWARLKSAGCWVFTSNVDGQFQKAGFDPACIEECHGSIHQLQCLEDCGGEVWPATAVHPDVDERACLWRGPLPNCPRCGRLARLNILMFGDYGWNSEPTERRHLGVCAAEGVEAKRAKNEDSFGVPPSP